MSNCRINSGNSMSSQRESFFQVCFCWKGKGNLGVTSCLGLMSFRRLWFCTGPALQKWMNPIGCLWNPKSEDFCRWIKLTKSVARCMGPVFKNVSLYDCTTVVVWLLWWWWPLCAGRSVGADRLLLCWEVLPSPNPWERCRQRRKYVWDRPYWTLWVLDCLELGQ